MDVVIATPESSSHYVPPFKMYLPRVLVFKCIAAWPEKLGILECVIMEVY